MDRTKLYNILRTYFDDTELKELCFFLKIDDENLPAHGKQDKARELVEYCERHSRLTELEDACRKSHANAFRDLVWYLGIDLGTTNSSVCYTRFSAERQQFEDPSPVRFGDTDVTRSLLLLDVTGQKVVASGMEVYDHPDYEPHPERVHEEFKLLLEKDPEATLYTRLLAGRLFMELKRTLRTDALSPEEYITTVGVPAEWERCHPNRVEIVKQAVREAGFPNVEAVDEPVAAMYYHAFLGHIAFENRLQRWLVIDIGGGTTDLAIVQTTEGGTRPTVLHTFGAPFGGKDFDELLLEKLILVPHWSGPPPDAHQRFYLLQFIRRFKETFSNHVKGGDPSYTDSYYQGSTKFQVTLTREIFASPDLGRPLIHRFAGILLEGFSQSGLAARDIDRVILTGGSSRWYFVREAVTSFLGSERCVASERPELTIANGLALARTGFKMSIAPSAASELELTLAADAPREINVEACRRRARGAYTKYVALAGGVALLVSPVPGASQPFLTGIEAKLVMEVAEVYGFKLTQKELMTTVGGLLAGGMLLKLGVMEAMTFVPGVGWVIKGGVAAAAIPALGEAAIKYFEARRIKPKSGSSTR